MIITFTNVIGAIRNAISSVITTNLKMWLGFETSETLGREEVVNGDFATDSDWTKRNGSTINNVANVIASGTIGSTSFNWSLESSDNVFEPSKYYQIKFRAKQVSSAGSIAGAFQVGNSFGTLFDEVITSEFVDYTFTAQASSNNWPKLTIGGRIAGDVFQIDDISVKELTQITPDKSGNNNVGELFTGKALNFDANGDYVDISGFSMSGNNATFAFWAYIRNNLRADYFFDFYSTSTRFLFGFGQASRKLAIYSNSGSGSWQDFGDPPQDQWVRIVLTVNGTTAKCFVDGVQLGTDKTISTYDFSTPTTAHIGARYTPEFNPKWYDGLLSDFQIYNSVWAADDIAYDYANPQNLVTDRDNPTIALSNLKAYWAMSEGDGKVAYDSSGEGNNGTINGATYVDAQPIIPQLGMMNWSKGSNLLINSNGFDASPYSSNDVTIVAGQEAPDGTATAFKITSTGSSSYVTLSGVAVNSNMRSIYARTVTGTGDIQLTSHSDNTNNTFTITTQWQRFSATSGVNVASNFYAVDFRGASTTLSEVVIWGAQIDDGTTLGAYRLTDGGATLNSTVIANPTIPTKDIFGNLVRDRLNSFNLDGSGYSNVANSSTLQFGTSAFTIQAWIKPFSLAANNRILTKGVTGNGEFMISVGGDNASVRVFAKDSNGNSLDTTNFFSTLTINSWQMITVLIDTPNDQILFFKNDGNVETNTGASWTGNFNSTQPITIGNTSSVSAGEFFDGLVSDALVYGRGLTSDEIKNNYNAGLSAHTNN